MEAQTPLLPEMRPRRRKWRIALLGVVSALLIFFAAGWLQQGRRVATVPAPGDGEPGRWIRIDGAENTRDIGGYKTRDGHTVRRGLVYRSGTLSHVTDDGCKTFRELGVVTVVDLRNRLSPLPLYNGDVLGIHRAAKVYGFPTSFKAQQPWQELYVRGFRENADSFRRTFELLARPERLPLMYHCRDGADRTGVMTALLLTMLGVDRETVTADFQLSERVGHPGTLDAMKRLLDEVDARGGIERFLGEAGVSPEVQARVRERLLAQ